MLDALGKYVHWDLVAMAVAMAVIFGFEMLGVFTDKYVTITAIIRATVPIGIRLLIWAWLGYHFLLAPANFK